MVKSLHLPGLQILRAVAALCVLVHHSVFYAAMATGANIDAFMHLNLGSIGVYVFFALSGAVMALSSEQPASKFAVQRLLRIYPPYIAALALATLIGLPVGVYSRLWEDFSLTLLPTGGLNTTFFVPYWTLVYEMFFYAVLWVLIITTPRLWHSKLLLGWAVLIIIAHPFIPAFQSVMPNLWQTGLSPLCIYFVAGYLTGTAIRSKDLRELAAAGFIVAVAGGLSFQDFGLVSVYCALACSAIYFGVVWPANDRTSKGLVWIGDRSYGLYLLHLPVCSLVLELTRNSGLSIWLIAGLMAVASGGVGLAFGHLEFEAHRRWLKPLARRVGSISARLPDLSPGTRAQQPLADMPAQPAP